MITDNMEYLYSDNGLDYYLIDEVGFSQNEYAKNHKLYENFGKSSSSTYYEIFTKHLFEDKQIHQIWVFSGHKPVALGLAVHFEEYKNIKFQNIDMGEVLGQIQLYVVPEFRGQGIAGQMTTLLEKSYLKYDKGFIIMQDDAYKFKSCLQDFIAIPNNYDKNIAYKEFVHHNIKTKSSFSEPKP